jgi:hypothetical protein
MAYKFQLGEAQLSGALVQEGAIKIHNESGTQVGIMKQDGTVSGSGELQGSAVDVDGAVDGKDGFKVNGTAIVDSARAVSNVTTIAMGGALSGVTTLAASGLASIASISMDDGSTIGPDSVSDLWTYSADGDTTQKDGAYDFDLASHDGTNGLKLGGVLVNASAADLNFTNVAAAGTVEASKAVVVDANKDATGFRSVTASANVVADKFFGNGAGITNINVGNLDAAGSDQMVQFNQNGEFAAVAGLKFNASGTMALSGSSSGFQASELFFGTAASKQGRIYVDEDEGYALSIYSPAGGLDLSASDGVTAMVGNGTNLTVASSYTNTGLALTNMSGQAVIDFGHDGVMSGSGALTVNSISVNGAASLSNAGVISGSGKIEGGGTLTIAGNSDLNGNLDVAGTTIIGSTLTAASLGSATVDLTADLMIIDDGAAGSIKTTSLANYSTAIAGAGLASTAGVLAVVNATNGGLTVNAATMQLNLNDLAGGAVSVANDSIAIVDADDSNKSKKESIADLVSAMAGAGITATNGVLSTQAQTVHTDFNAGIAIEEGYNIYTGSANISVALPASAGLTAGDVFVVKQGAAGDVTIAANGSDLIDGAGSIVLESPFAAVSVLFTGVANTFRII